MTASRSIKTCKLSLSCLKAKRSFPAGRSLFLVRDERKISNGFRGHVCHSFSLSRQTFLHGIAFHLHSKSTIGETTTYANIKAVKAFEAVEEALVVPRRTLSNFLRNKNSFAHMRGERFAKIMSL